MFLFKTTKITTVLISALILFLVTSAAHAQVVLTLDYQAKAGTPASVPSGQYYTMQLNYAVSSTTGSASGVKVVVSLPDAVSDGNFFVGTTHAPTTNFVFDGTAGAKKLTITFIDPVPSGSTGVLEFALRSINGTTPNGTIIHTCAIMTDGSGATSGQKCHDETMTAAASLCANKTLASAGAVGYNTSYNINLGISTLGYSYMVSAGVLTPTNVSVTDTYPAGAEFVSAVVLNNGTPVSPQPAITHSGNSFTIGIPNYTVYAYGLDWNAQSYSVLVTLKYNAGFSAGQSVTNQAAVTYTPLGGSPITLSNGQTSTCGAADLIETHTLAAPNANATLQKDRDVSTVLPGQSFYYSLRFVNSGNVPLDNVEIIETVPSDIRLTGIKMVASAVTNIAYELNDAPGTWVVLPDKSLPTPPVGKYYTKLKFIFVSPLLPGDGMNGWSWDQTITFVPATEVTTPVNVTNCVVWNSTTAGIPTEASRTVCNSNVTLIPRATTAGIGFEHGHSPGCVAYSVGQDITFLVILTALDGYSDLANPTIGLVIPKGYEFVSDTFSPENSGLTATPTLTTVNNFQGNKTLYRWAFPSGTTIPYGKKIKVTLTAKTTAALPPAPADNGGFFILDGSNVSFISNPDYYGSSVDLDDWDGDANTTESHLYIPTSHASCRIQIPASASMESIKWVKGLCDTEYSKYPNYGQTVPGGNADYKLIVKNTGNVTMKDIKIIDILPFIGDKGVIDPQARLTAWTPNLADPIAAPAGITVYYSTSGNPCRDEVKGTNPSPFPTGCETPNWATTPPANITAVKSVKIDFGTKTLAGGDSLIFSWPMRAPINAPTNNEIAWNSFAFVATRSDNNEALIAAEPNKVGIKVKPGAPAYYGNRVWYDTNHDGKQDAGEGGVDGVKVKLFKVPTLGTTPNPATDELINFTITGNGGFYKFSNLAAGFYYAVFCLPTGYQISPKNTGTSINDSDGSPTTYQGQTATITAVTELIATEDDDSWDQGIFCAFTPVITSNSPVGEGETLTMSVSPSTGAYSWSGPNGWTATGASVTKTNMQLVDAGEYYVNMYENADGSGCWATLSASIVVANCVPPNAGEDQTVCLPKTSSNLTDAPAGYEWVAAATNSPVAIIHASTGVVTGMTATGTYKFRLQQIGDATCADEMQITVTNGDTPIVLCNNGSTTYNVVAPSNLTNVKWYNNANQEVGTGNTLTVSSALNGLTDGSEAFYYIGTDSSTNAIIEQNCPTKFLTQTCCPVPNCAGVTVIKN